MAKRRIRKRGERIPALKGRPGEGAPNGNSDQALKSSAYTDKAARAEKEREKALAEVAPLWQGQMREMLRGLAIMGTVTGGCASLSYALSLAPGSPVAMAVWTVAGALLGLMAGRILAFLIYAPPRIGLMAAFGFAAGMLVTGKILLALITALLGLLIGAWIKGNPLKALMGKQQ